MSASSGRARADPSARLVRLSRLVALVLRHRPEEVGVELDPAGFADLEALARAIAGQPGWASVTRADLEALARADPRRYEIRDGRIRARYGHTVSLDAPGEVALPPEWLYIGVSARDVTRVCERGLEPAQRQLVHLATTPRAALEVGQRHADDAVAVVVFARRAAAAGVVFRRAGTALWLTERVPPAYLQPPAPRPDAAGDLEATVPVPGAGGAP